MSSQQWQKLKEEDGSPGWPWLKVRSYHKNDQRIRGLEMWLKHRELASRRL
jgi:hypothetical protein